MDGNKVTGKVGNNAEDAKAEQLNPKWWSFLRERPYTFSGVLVYLHMATLVFSVRPAV